MGIFTKNILHTFSTQVIGFFLAIAISIIITRGLGPEGKGIFALASLIVSFLMLPTGLGLNQATTYFTGNKKYSAKDILSSNVVLSSLISIIGVAAGLAIILFFNTQLFPSVPRIYLLLSLSLFPVVYFFDLISQVLMGLQRIQAYNVLKLIPSVLYLVFLAIPFFASSLTVGIAIGANVAAQAIIGIALFSATRKAAGGFTFSLNIRYVKDALIYGFQVYLANIFYLARPQVNAFLLNIYLNPRAVGLYVTALGLSEVMQWFSRSTATVLFPRVAAEEDKDRRKQFTPVICRNVMAITFLAAIILIFFGKWLILLLYSQKFLESLAPFQILLIGTVPIAGWLILNTDIFAQGKPMINTYIFAASVAMNILLDLWWIPTFGLIGAAWALTASYFLIFILTLVAYMKISRNALTDVVFVKPSDFLYYRNAVEAIVKKALSSKR